MEYKPTTKIVLSRGNGKNLWNVLNDYVKYFIKNITALKNMNMLKDTFMN